VPPANNFDLKFLVEQVDISIECCRDFIERIKICEKLVQQDNEVKGANSRKIRPLPSQPESLASRSKTTANLADIRASIATLLGWLNDAIPEPCNL
jgi:hypothetical protein